jgi:predicted CDP-diglyceride synthetase/phosphatidate cytidylyltransferase
MRYSLKRFNDYSKTKYHDYKDIVCYYYVVIAYSYILANLIWFIFFRRGE